jgi:hypothetical protein
MMKAVKWFYAEEEFCIGLVLMNNGREMFITEEAVRFDAPFLTVCDTLQEAVDRKWFISDLTYEDLVDEDKAAYDEELAEITKKYVKTKKGIFLHRFLKTMDERFEAYKRDGIMESYKYDEDTATMWLSEKDDTIDHGYMWSALDGALFLWNTQNKPYYIDLEEYTPDENGMIKYEFGIHCEGEDDED